MVILWKYFLSISVYFYRFVELASFVRKAKLHQLKYLHRPSIQDFIPFFPMLKKCLLWNTTTPCEVQHWEIPTCKELLPKLDFVLWSRKSLRSGWPCAHYIISGWSYAYHHPTSASKCWDFAFHLSRRCRVLNSEAHA